MDVNVQEENERMKMSLSENVGDKYQDSLRRTAEIQNMADRLYAEKKQLEGLLEKQRYQFEAMETAHQNQTYHLKQLISQQKNELHNQ